MLTLKWTEMMWLLEGDSPFEEHYLGEAGNPFNGDQVTAVRYGGEVLVASGRRNEVIPASAVVKGFGPDKDGRTLEDLMEEGVVYSYALTPLK